LDDSLLVYEYVKDNTFQRTALGVPDVGNVWSFGDGDNDGRMELLTMSRGVKILESPARDSFPTDSVWGSLRTGAGYPYPRYVNLDPSGREEVAFTSSMGGICLYENSGDNRYDTVTVLRDDSTDSYGNCDVGDFDRDSAMELVAGTNGGWVDIFEATDSYPVLAARCTTSSTYANWHVAAAHDMDHNGWPEIIVTGNQGVPDTKLMVFEAYAPDRYHCVWEKLLVSGETEDHISVGDVDGDGTDEFAVATGGGISLFKSTGLQTYTQVWRFDSASSWMNIFDINQDGRAEVIFDGPNGTEIWEDTEGLGVAEFSKFSLESPVRVSPSVARLGASLLLSGIPPGSGIEVLSIDGRLVSRTQVRQSTWTWNLRNQAGNLVPAGTYFAVIRSRGKSTSLKLCLVR
jgi:hypothetical protein